MSGAISYQMLKACRRATEWACRRNERACGCVSKCIEGIDLSAKLKQSRLKYTDAAELVATVAQALHYAHQQGREARLPTHQRLLDSDADGQGGGSR